MAGRKRNPSPNVVLDSKSRTRIRGRAEDNPPKIQGEGKIAQILFALDQSKENHSPQNGNLHRACKIIIAAAGSRYPQQLHPAHAYEIETAISQTDYAHSTKRNTAAAAIRVLAWLSKHYGAPEIGDLISRHPGLRPRNVTATEEEKAAILAAAPIHMRLWILLCSDLAIRSGTAARLGPQHNDQARGLLKFTTKMGEKLTLPTTAEIAELIARCDQQDPEPFVKQLHKGVLARARPHEPLTAKRNYTHTLGTAFIRLRQSVGITRKLTPHDFRRTTAVKLYEATGDARDVQALLGHRTLASTIWYLDHDLRPVNRAHLELIKNPNWKKEKAS